MAPSIKLTYFNIRGLAENIRLILAQAGVEYEDNRIEFADWPALKETTPFGKLPVLEYDGKMLCESIAICRFLAKENGLTGPDNWTAAEADMVVDSIMDMTYRELMPVIKAKEEEKEALKAKCIEEVVPKVFGALIKQLEKNGGSHFAGSELTWADIIAANMFDSMSQWLGMDLADKYPVLNDFKNKVYDLPNIKKWIETRPVTDK